MKRLALITGLLVSLSAGLIAQEDRPLESRVSVMARQPRPSLNTDGSRKATSLLALEADTSRASQATIESRAGNAFTAPARLAPTLAPSRACDCASGGVCTCDDCQCVNVSKPVESVCRNCKGGTSERDLANKSSSGAIPDATPVRGVSRIDTIDSVVIEGRRTWLAQVAPPSPATAVIEGPKQVNPGDLLVLSATSSNAAAYAWKVYPSKTILPVEGGKQCVFSSGTAGVYTFVLATAKGDTVAMTEHAVIVGVPPVVPPGPTVPPVDPNVPPVVVPSEKATAAVYVYEKDATAVPGGVLAALNKLNRERGIVATLFEEDTTDGSGDTPDQYKVAVTAAKEAGLPALVVQAGPKVLSVVKNPTTAEDVLKAVP